MRISSGGSQDINLLQSDAAQFRNIDFVVDNQLTFTYGNTVAGVAANFSMAQLKNPIGSGVVTFLDRIIVAAAGTVVIVLSSFATDLATLVVNWVPGRVGGTSGLSEVRIDNQAASVGGNLAYILTTANRSFEFVLESPLELLAGQGVVVQLGSSNVALAYTFIGREV